MVHDDPTPLQPPDLDAPNPAYARFTPEHARALLASLAPATRELLAQLVVLRLLIEDAPGVAFAPAQATIVQPLLDAEVVLGLDADATPAEQERELHLYDATWGPIPSGLHVVNMDYPLLGFVGALLSGRPWDGLETVDAYRAGASRLRVFPFYPLNPLDDAPGADQRRQEEAPNGQG